MPKLSQFTDKTIPVEAHVRGERVSLKVRPYRWTIEAEAAFIADQRSEDAHRAKTAVLSFFLSVVDEWDVTDDEGQMIPLTHEQLEAFPTVLLAEILEEAKSALSFRKRG